MPLDSTIREFDPNNPIPPGLKNARVKERFVSDEILEEDETEEFLNIDEEEVDDELLPPSSMSVVSQVVRTAPDGRQVVDVVIEVEDIEDAVYYNVRLTKI